MKTMYKVIVAMMIMTITTAPVFAGNKVDRKKKTCKEGDGGPQTRQESRQG